MADEAFFTAVVGEGDGAVVALDDVAAGGTLKGAGEAAAVEEDDDLFVRFEAFLDGSTKDIRDDGISALVFLGLDAHVDDACQGEGGSVGAFGEFDELVFAESGVLEGLERGGGGAENDGALFEVAANDGEIPGVVFGRVFLFVGGFVFFIDDDETGVLEGREDGGAGSDDDAGFAGADAVPFVKTLALGKMGVEDSDLVDEFVEAGLEALDGLGGEGDLGDEDDDLFAEIEGGPGGLEVDFGFTGAGDAVEEDGGGLVGVEAFEDGFVNFGLFVVEGEGLGGDEGFVGIGVAADLEVDDFDPAFFGEGFQGSGGGGATEIGDGDGLVGNGEEGDDLVLSLGAFGEGGEFFFGRRVFEHGGAAGFGGAFFAPDGRGDDGADDLFEGRAVVGGDPLGELQERRGDEGFGIDEVGEVAEGEVALGLVGNTEDGAGGGAVAQGNANAAAGEDVEIVGDGVVEDEFGGAVDENAGGERHALGDWVRRWTLDGGRETWRLPFSS